MNRTKIEWCDYTWNPVTGCLHNCEYCYGKRIAHRFSPNIMLNHHDVEGSRHWDYDYKGQIGNFLDIEKPIIQNGRRQPFPRGYEPTFHRYRLDEPMKLKKPAKIFVVSMGDLFGDWVPDEWINEVIIEGCQKAPHHTYYFLTKNPKRYHEVMRTGNDYRIYMWFGASITSDTKKDILRAWELLRLPRKVNTFLSIEPLLGPVNLNRYELLLENWRYNCTMGKYIDWIIVGAQTGPGSVKPQKEWVEKIIEQCRDAKVPVFLKDNLNWPEPIQEWPKTEKR